MMSGANDGAQEIVFAAATGGAPAPISSVASAAPVSTTVSPERPSSLLHNKISKDKQHQQQQREHHIDGDKGGGGGDSSVVAIVSPEKGCF